MGNENLVKKDNFLKRTAMVSLGGLIYALAINIFISPNKLLSGGIAGMSLLAQYVTNTPSGYWVFILNVPIFILGLKKIDKDFIVFSLIGTITMSIFLILTKNISNIIVVDDLIMATIFGAIISGIGMGLVFKSRASQGGTDIIAVIIRNKNGAKMSTLYFLLNGAIVLLGVVATNLKLTLYTITLMYIKAIVIEKVITGFDEKKILMIVTGKEKQISNAIMYQIGRGTTYLYGEGGYTGERKKIIYCLVTNKELNRVKKSIDSIDSNALVSICNAKEITGRGFLRPAI